MESFIGNLTNAKMNNHNAYQDDPYENMFEEDIHDDEDIFFIDDYVSSGLDSDKEVPLNEKYDEHLGLELLFPSQGEMKSGKTVRRKRDHTGHLIGKSHSNPILDTRIYEVKFNDGTFSDYTANTIMKN